MAAAATATATAAAAAAAVRSEGRGAMQRVAGCRQTVAAGLPSIVKAPGRKENHSEIKMTSK